MNAFGFVMALGAIASARAGLILPSTIISAHGVIAPQALLTPVAPSVLLTKDAALEGQYIPDNLEKLDDDGSYKPEIYEAPFTASTYAVEVTDEGQYVPDNLEKLYDDGSYKEESTTLPGTTSQSGSESARSDLDGQYVPDVSEKLFDDGLYKPEQPEA